jgi:hypothetical protein
MCTNLTHFQRRISFITQELFIHNRGNPQFLTFNHSMTTHVSMAIGVETGWQFADWVGFCRFLHLSGGAVSLHYREINGDGTIEMVDWIS